MSQPDVDQLIQKTRQYEFADGLRDFQLAVLFGFGGAASWLALQPFWFLFIVRTVQTYGRWVGMVVGMLPMILAILAVWGMLRLMDMLRRRWLWRDSGMVKSLRWAVPRRVNVLSAVILLAGIAIGFALQYIGRADNNFALRMIWIATGWSFGYTLYAMGRYLSLPRYIWLGPIGGLLSTLMLFLPLGFAQSSLVFGLIWALMLVISGTIALRHAMPAVKEAQ